MALKIILQFDFDGMKYHLDFHHWLGEIHAEDILMWPWTTKPVLSVCFSKLRFIYHPKAE